MARRVSRRVLEMSDQELSAIIAVAMPGRKIDGLRRDERQEICMKWLFGNGLSMNHIFMFEMEDDDIYVLMSNKKACECCPKENDTVSIRSFDRTPIGSSLAIYTQDSEGGHVQLNVPNEDVRPSSALSNPHLRAPEVHRSQSDNSLSTKSKPATLSPLGKSSKIQPITTQPQPAHIGPPKKEEPEPDDNCCRTFCREYGHCCVNLWSAC